MLYECIDDFIRAKITVAAQGISKEACQKISSGDVIMVYAWYLTLFLTETVNSHLCSSIYCTDRAGPRMDFEG